MSSITAVTTTSLDALWKLATIPFGRCDWVDAQNVHCINFFQRAVLGLNHEEENDGHESSTATCKYQTVPVVDGISDEASEEGDAFMQSVIFFRSSIF